jgi:hypothetical protein
VKAKRIQCDEVWAFVGAKDKNIPAARRGEKGLGSIWTWTAIDADSELIVGYHVGTRDGGCAYEFMTDVAERLAGRVQLTTDGHRAYLDAVDYAFGGAVDYAMLVKLYGEAPEPAGRYSPARESREKAFSSGTPKVVSSFTITSPRTDPSRSRAPCFAMRANVPRPSSASFLCSISSTL